MATGVQLDISKLLEIQKHISTAISDGIKHTGEDVKVLAAQLAPKDEGDLSLSGKVEMIAETTVEVSFGNDLPDIRAVAQEFGTVYLPAQPYLNPAVAAIDTTFRIKEKLGL